MALKEREGYHKRVMEKELDLENKRDNAAMINRVSIQSSSYQCLQHQKQFVAFKQLNKAQIDHEVSKNYYLNQEKRQQQISDAQDKIKQLENVESYLVEQLSKTQRT